MSSDEQVQISQIRQVILENDLDKEYEFEVSSSSYDLLKAEFTKDEENEQYPRLFYDWTRQVITIVTGPSCLHEDTAQYILTSLSNRLDSIMHREQITLAADESVGSSHSPRALVNNGISRYQMEPDGVIFYRTKRSRDFKAVIEVGISETYDSLLEKARKWIFGKKCNVVILLSFNERRQYERPRRRISLTTCEVTERIEQMRSNWHSQISYGPLAFRGHTWLEQFSEGFIDVVRINPGSDGSNPLLTRKIRKSYFVLLHEGRNESSSVPKSVGDIRIGELIPRESLNNVAASELIIDFFDAEDFMNIVRGAMIDTAVDRFEAATTVTA
ncbi:hypothetical protein V1525DRAFT_348828 [Lipomyces kononenkoae]|uniref:Uncharacterized protein n=1 Tax=Lipomyces kononenkoae TaxID=34357 RepID=A0ACC3SU67_LIPKO